MLNPTINKSISEFLDKIIKKYQSNSVRSIYIEKYNSYYIIVDNKLFTNKSFIDDFWEFENKFIINFPSSNLVAYSDDNSIGLNSDFIEVYTNESLLEIA